MEVPNIDRPTTVNSVPNGHSQGVLTAAIIISLIFGTVSGSVFGVLAANHKLGSWLDRSVLGTTSNAVTTTVSGTTVQVQEESATVDVVKNVSPAVVSVIGTQDFSKISRQPNYFSPFGDYFGTNYQQPQGKQDVLGGSGFIVSSDGLILTNKHVVDTQNIDYSVVLNDGTRVDATVLALDPNFDLAILKIDKTGLPVVKLADSDKIQVGETVIAIGNALGQYPNSVTKGVISGLGRTITAGDNTGNSETIENTIQTDAAINEGNSGGPLLNISGEVVGVNTAVSAQGQLVGFAIPINAAKQDITSVKESGKIVRPYIGIRYSPINKEVQSANDLSVDYGAIIIRGESAGELAVIPGSPADKAGLVENDIILEIDGKKITEDLTIADIIATHKVGDALTLKILHTGDEKTVQLTLGERSS